MGLLVIGLATALVYSRTLTSQTAGGGNVASGGAKVIGIFLIVLWCVIILAGRWIAYAPS